MEDKNKDMSKETAPEQAFEIKEKEDGREISDKLLDDVAGGTVPVIRPF